MKDVFDTDSVICAQATPGGRSGVAVVRLSGINCFSLVRKLAPKLTDKPESHRLYFTKLINPLTQEMIDEVLVSYFTKGKSYTGDESVEISCHGNPIITAKIMEELIKLGARTAGPGEFTYRAFINGKIDLVQAESVLNLIEANSGKSAKLSARQLEGELSTEIKEIEDKLIYLLANFEASIDFVEEDIEIVDYTAAENLASKLLKSIKKLITSYHAGKVIKDGLNIALVGAPNAGKSSLLNALLKQEKAIVSDIPGTTRDVIEASIQISGLSIHFFDTAGIRETSDKIEKLGIQRSEKAIEDCDHVFYVVDPLDFNESDVKQFVSSYLNKNSTLLVSKSDLVSQTNLDLITQTCQNLNIETLHKMPIKADLPRHSLLVYSSVSENGISQIEKLLEKLASDYHFEDSGVIQQARHYELLLEVEESLEKGIELIKQKDSVEFISYELHNAIYKLHEILGKKFDDEVMDRVFKEFCIGK